MRLASRAWAILVIMLVASCSSAGIPQEIREEARFHRETPEETPEIYRETGAISGTVVDAIVREYRLSIDIVGFGETPGDGGIGVKTLPRISEEGKPLAFANVLLLGTGVGTFTKDDGTFTIGDVPVGTYDVKVMMFRYASQTRKGVVVKSGQTTELNFELYPSLDMRTPLVRTERKSIDPIHD